MNGDGKMIANGVLTGVAGMAPEIQKIVNGAMGEELHQKPVQHVQPEQMTDVNAIIQGSLGTAAASIAMGQQITNGAMAGDGQQIANGILGGVGNMAPQIQQIVNGAMGEELNQQTVQ